MSQQHQKNKNGVGQKWLWFAALPDVVWAPLTAGGLMLMVGIIGLLAHQPWLFPSLGPTAFLQVETPGQPTARFYNTVIGHCLGLGAGFLSVALVGAQAAPAVLSTHHLTPIRVWAAVLAVGLNMLFGLLLKASHPPAAATTLLVALGGFEMTVHGALTVVAGVMIVATVGEVLRRIRLQANPVHFS
ncbi:hypothetical protein SAMD00079811_12010 [Scytonema sp. HK-05]|uniref:HPP family protein n=1 Tax=Scytonema sp. HK-05 TaxID=1137095 RepID=UPI000936FD65|nr:HPP family protein [Scytonema sp. HK-05]OKH60241.1 hypothetical protein NIES2130_04000 [Scytonema sp. HK-05]BAY43621.1 hypothetical protein SAMD00079811_12010 [Scytonema sp. HK-05]